MAVPRSLLYGADQRRLLAVVDDDGLVEPGQLEDLPVMLAQPVGGELLMLPVRRRPSGTDTRKVSVPTQTVLDAAAAVRPALNP
jgi:hypothetical protein